MKRSHILSKHQRRRGHRHYHERSRESREAKNAQEKRDPVVLVTATMAGSVVTMTDTWNIPASSTPIAVSPAPARSDEGNTSTPVAAPAIDAGVGSWGRSAYYEAVSGTAEGLTFLGNVNWNSET